MDSRGIHILLTPIVTLALLLFALLPAAMPAAAANATLALSRTTLGPGDSLTATGTGFTAGDSVVVYADFNSASGAHRTQVTGTVASNGTFSVTFAVPNGTNPTTYHVVAKDFHGHTAGQTLRVLALLILKAGASGGTVFATAGTNFIVRGTGFGAGESVSIQGLFPFYDGNTLRETKAATADKNGNFGDVFVHAPLRAKDGTDTVTATGTTSKKSSQGHVNVAHHVTVAIKPATITPGHSVTVTGSGYVPGSTVHVSVTIPRSGGSTTTIGKDTVATSGGQISLSLGVPGNVQPGSYAVSATDTVGSFTTATHLAVARPAVPASLSISPASVIPGGSVTVKGSHYPAGKAVSVQVTIHLTNGKTQTLSATVSPNGAGDFSTTLHVPNNASGGAFAVTARSVTGKTASTRLVVGKLAPSVVAVPTTAAPGTAVTVKGFGFAAGEGVALTFAGQKVGSVTTNGSGQFSATFTIPAGTATGPYPIAASSSSGRHAGITLTVNRTVSTHYYFASEYTGSGYHEYLAFLNPTETKAQVTIQYQKTTGQTVSKSVTINPHTRLTEDVNADLGFHVSAGAAVAADVPIVAERVVYHGSDGSVVPGVTAPSRVWYFANGNTSHRYREYVAVQNPNTQPIQIQVHFLPTHHAQFTITRTMPATSRTTVKVSTYVPKDAVGVIVTASAPVVATRSIFIRHGMTSKIGVAAPKRHWYFAAGPGNSAARNWIGAINPFNRWAYLTLHAYNGSGQEVGTIKQWLRPFARVGYLMNKQAHAANVAVAMTASAGIIAEQTTYAGGMHDASTDTFGIAAPAKTFAFAFANTGNGQGDRLSLFNPNLSSIPVVVQFMTSGGQVSERTYVVSPLAHLAVDVGSVVPAAQLGLVAASNYPFVALNRAWYNNGTGAMTSTGIHP